MRRISPALVLFVLAPVIGELVSGSSPPLEFFNPPVFLLLAGLYGSGALTMRELKVRWHKDYRSLFLLGCAYAVLEEGLMVKSFFDPRWVDLNKMSWYGRWLEVNWVWTEMLTIYHAVFSIIVPTALVELAYPEKRNESWIGKRTFIALMALLFSETLIGLFALTTYIPPAPHYFMAIAAMALFILAAYKLKPKKIPQRTRKTGSSRLLFVVCTAGSMLFFVMFWSSPATIRDYPIVTMTLGIILVFAFVRFLSRLDWTSPHSDLNLLAAVSGALAFLIFLGFVQETRSGYLGMSFVSLSAIIALLVFRKRLKRRVQAKDISTSLQATSVTS